LIREAWETEETKEKKVTERIKEDDEWSGELDEASGDEA
jgi:hypothetical protein